MIKKKFDGKWCYLRWASQNRHRADVFASNIRKKGFFVRVIPYRDGYGVFVRRK